MRATKVSLGIQNKPHTPLTPHPSSIQDKIYFIVPEGNLTQALVLNTAAINVNTICSPQNVILLISQVKDNQVVIINKKRHV